VPDYTPYQRKIIERYYRNYDAIKTQKLAELVTEVYLAEGKARERLWTRIEKTLQDLEFPATRITHLMEKRDPALLPGILQEIQGQS